VAEQDRDVGIRSQIGHEIVDVLVEKIGCLKRLLE
jgi:hypothetical protein